MCAQGGGMIMTGKGSAVGLCRGVQRVHRGGCGGTVAHASQAQQQSGVG